MNSIRTSWKQYHWKQYHRITAYQMLAAITFFLFAAGLGISGCAKQHPVFGSMAAGSPVEIVTPERTMDRKNVPAGVDPDTVTAHISGPAGDEIWIVKKKPWSSPTVYHSVTSSPASTGSTTLASSSAATPMTIDIAKRSWYYWPLRVMVVIVVLLAIAVALYLKGIASSMLGWIGPIIELIKKLFGGKKA